MASRESLVAVARHVAALRSGTTSFASLALRGSAIQRRHLSEPAISSTAESVYVPPVTQAEAPSVAALLLYHVSRTKSDELPVYTSLKAGGTLKQTLVRKISGDSHALKRELQRHLRLPDERIAVNELTKHVVIKGWHKAAVMQFLEAKKF